jgi:hypothetical protein
VFRVAPDEAFIYSEAGELRLPKLSDEHAIITQDSSLAGIWLNQKEAHTFLEHECLWELPKTRPAFAQGTIAHLPAKLYFEQERVLVITSAVYALDLAKRLDRYLND